MVLLALQCELHSNERFELALVAVEKFEFINSRAGKELEQER